MERLAFLCLALFLVRLQSEGATYVVDRSTDANAAGLGEGAGLVGDLRFAINSAQSHDHIAFAVTGTIDLAASLPALTRDLNLEGPGANRLTVHGASGNVFAVGRGAAVVLSSLTLTGGAGNGGGILNLGTLTLNNVTVTGNVAGDATNGGGTGAGIWNVNPDSVLILNGCTVCSNSAVGNLSYNPSRGGGIANYGTMTLNNSTVSGNTASQGFGGGIENIGNLTLNNSTISSNRASLTAAGGIHAISGILLARSSIVAGNTGSDVFGALTSAGHNLIGDTNGLSGFNPSLGDLLNVNPLIGPLADYGGPTHTMALRVGSPALDAGASSALTTDQRGEARPYDNPNVVNAVGSDGCDIGACETSPLRIIAVEKIGSDLRLSFMSMLGANYLLQDRTDIVSGNWASLSGPMPGNGGIVQSTHTNAVGSANRFYRIQLQP